MKVFGPTSSILATIGILFVLGCGSSGTSGVDLDQTPTDPPPPTEPTDPPPPTEPEEPECAEEASFESSFDAIQKIVFDRQCVSCHSGDTASGQLDLSADVAYENLVEQDSVGTDQARVYPGSRDRSFLWRKVYANVDGSVVEGGPMPPSGEALDADTLELLRLWILGGAPETGTVLGTEDLLPGCLPDPTPTTIQPLTPPAADEGVQLVMPRWDLYAASEDEICTAIYYDFSDEIPEEFKSADGETFYYGGYEVRQDATSHHLILFLPVDEEIEDLNDVGTWLCQGGPRDGEDCEANTDDPCGDGGICHTEVETSLACINYAPVFTGQEIAVQQAQTNHDLYPGTFREMPTRGVAFFNSHAFNLTTQDHRMNGRINVRFATDRRYPQREAGGFDTAFGIPKLLAAGAPPYSENVLCERMVLPRGTRITAISSHTHRQGKHFWYEMPNGDHIYDSFIYNDPVNLFLDEPMAFDQEDPADRTLTYCALYRNGVDAEGNLDPEEVTRASRIKYPLPFGNTLGLCEPVRCVTEGMLDVECDDGIDNQRGDDAACDTSPGAGDGLCDACRITGGITTENEMFGAQVWYFIADGFEDEEVLFPDSISVGGLLGG